LGLRLRQPHLRSADREINSVDCHLLEPDGPAPDGTVPDACEARERAWSGERHAAPDFPAAEFHEPVSHEQMCIFVIAE